MQIGIIGAGKIGSTLARKFSSAGHDVRLANSRGPETVRDVAEATGASAAHASVLVTDSDVVIVSIPFEAIPRLSGVFAGAPRGVIVIDTSNYFPFRDGELRGLSAARTESDWVGTQLGRPVIKAWNSILAGSLATKGRPSGESGRIALPVAGDDTKSKTVALELVETSGFDAVDAGTLEQSWRQEPGNPAYCTDLDVHELKKALDRADRATKTRKRDILADQVFAARENFTDEDILALGRSVYN